MPTLANPAGPSGPSGQGGMGTPTPLAFIGTLLPPTATPAPGARPSEETDTPIPPTATLLPPTLTATDTFAPSTATSLPPTPTWPLPTPTLFPTDTPTNGTLAATPDATASVIEYVVAGVSRSMSCQDVRIYGSVLDANNSGVPNISVEVIGIHDTSGQYLVQTNADGRYEITLGGLTEVPAGQWYVAVVRDNMEVSERFHWASTPVCSGDDKGNSQHLRVDWKLVE